MKLQGTPLVLLSSKELFLWNITAFAGDAFVHRNKLGSAIASAVYNLSKVSLIVYCHACSVLIIKLKKVFSMASFECTPCSKLNLNLLATFSRYYRVLDGLVFIWHIADVYYLNPYYWPSLLHRSYSTWVVPATLLYIGFWSLCFPLLMVIVRK